MRRRALAVWLAAAVCAALPAMAQSPTPGRTYRVGYAQIVDHPALNATRQGFLDALKAAGFEPGRNLQFDYLNAQGDVANARNIAETFVADHVDLIAPCTTPVVQAAIRVTRGSGVPVAFGCVTNPVQSGILASLDKPTGSNVTGAYGILPIAQMFDLLVQLKPDAKRVGTIYNPAEGNSAAQNEIARAEAAKRGLAWVEVQVASSAEVRSAADSLVGRTDTWLTLQDNTVASAYDAVSKVAHDAHIPLFALDTTAVERGAIAAYGQNQYKIGVQWANEVAIPVLLGRDPGTITPITYSSYDIFLNAAAASAGGLTIPPELLGKAAQVYGK